jgi:ELWxxDGT repeat protein
LPATKNINPIMKKLSTIVALLACGCSLVQAQSITRLIADSTSKRAAYPGRFTTVGNKIMFTGRHETNTNSWALYKTDGTDAGTVMVSSLSDHAVPPVNFIALGNLLLFQNYNNSGNEPWVSDGTDAGTKMLKDMRPGSTGAGFEPVGALGGFIYFMASPAGVSGLWKTDGTENGTTEVKPATMKYNSITFNNKLYFWGTVSNLFGLYSIDASSNVQLVKALKSANNFGAPIAIASDKFYFAFDDSAAGIEPWVSDGTTTGTFMLKDIMAGSGNSLDMGGSGAFSSMAILNDKLYFNPANGSGRALWTSDGTSNGTTLVTSTIGTNPQIFCVANNTLFYQKENPSRIGISNGTEAGTKLLLPESNTDGISTFGNFISFNNKVVFGGTMVGKEDAGMEPWISDGTPEGTFILRDINPTPYAASFDPQGTDLDYAVLGGKLYVSCNDGASSKVWVIETGGPSSGLLSARANQYAISSAYPNPAQRNITIASSLTDATLTVIDVTGKNIITAAFNKELQLSVHEWTPGVYYYTLIDRSGRSGTGKLVIE